MKKYLFLLPFLLSGCFQVTSQDEELCTIPVTNNPQLIPQGNSVLPSGLPGSVVR